MRGTEKYWQEEKARLDFNKDTMHPVIKTTEEEFRKNIPMKHPKYLYAECLKGALYWRQWAQADTLTIDEMATIICRDVGCELQYCMSTMSDPYERPFNDCNEQLRNMSSCIRQEQRRFIENSEGRNMQEQVMYMLDMKKKGKYKHLFEPKVEQKEREYFIKDNSLKLKEEEMKP